MKKLLIVSIVILFTFSCKKSNNNSPQTAIEQTATKIGLVFEKKYNLISNIGWGSSITFHSNQTITEISDLGSDSFTYAAIYMPSSDNSTSVLKDGVAIKIYLPNDTGKVNYTFYNRLKTNFGYADTATFGTYLTGDIIQNNKPTFGCLFNTTSYAYTLN